jgi:hypothetical protein
MVAVNKQGVDVGVARLAVRSVEVEVLPVADARHQLDAEQMREAEDRRALAVGVGMHRVRLQGAAVLADEVEDGMALVGAAGDEA